MHDLSCRETAGCALGFNSSYLGAWRYDVRCGRARLTCHCERKRSNPSRRQGRWIASSLALLAMTGSWSEYRFNQGGDLPDGLSRNFPVQPLCEKFSAFPVGQITFINSPRPASTRGAYASSRTWGGMRWTRAAHGRMRLTRGRRSRVVLTPRRWRQVRGKTPRAMVANKPGHQGEREGNR